MICSASIVAINDTNVNRLLSERVNAENNVAVSTEDRLVVCCNSRTRDSREQNVRCRGFCYADTSLGSPSDYRSFQSECLEIVFFESKRLIQW